MPEPVDPDDTRGLIREAFRIDGIGAPECRSILVDWALGLPADTKPHAVLARLAERAAAHAPDHPMTTLLREAAASPAQAAVRRGGRAGRRGLPPGRRPET